MTKAFEIVRDALVRAEKVRYSDVEELIFNKKDLTPEFMALANGYKMSGGDGLYILQTLDLKSVSIRETDEDTVSIIMWATDFLGWANTVTRYD